MPLFADLDRLKAELDALRPLPPEQEQRVMQKFRLEWNYNSNAIEGNSLTLGETRALLLHDVVASGKRMRDHDDIRNHNKAIAEVESLVDDERPVTEHLIREMHATLMGREPYYVAAQTADGTPTRQLIEPGNYKKIPNHAVTATGEPLHFASPEETSAEMTDLMDWYRQEVAQPTLHPIDLAAKFHYRFVRIHPFDDGNGRMSRLLMNLILMRAGYPTTVIKADDRNRYLAALAQADAGEPEPFLRFVIENVEASLQLMIRAAKGESVDEPSDLDKKLALLRKQVLSREEFIETTWNIETQARLYNAILRFWLVDLGEQMNRFNDFFQHHEISFQGFFSNSLNRAQFPPPSSDLSVFLIEVDNRFNSLHPLDELSQVTLIFKWNAFRGTATTFSQTLNIFFFFKQRQFQFMFTLHDSSMAHATHMAGAPQLLLESDYKLEYDHTRIQEVNHQIANKVYNFIEAKLAEADALPPQP